MKNTFKKITVLFGLAITLACFPMQASMKIELMPSENVAIVKDDLVGGWEYTVADAPEGYGSGLLMIVKQDAIYKVQVQTGGGALNGSNVVVKGNNISFTVNVEGENVTVSLSAKGSSLTGTSTSSAGVFKITGVKSISAE